jgi:hypothetical protein
MVEQKKIKIVFKKGADYRLLPINGAWGGMTPRGDFILDFFVEHNTTPDSIIHEITPEGKLGGIIEKHPGDEQGVLFVTRELVGGILMSVEHAKSIADFISDKCADFEKDKASIKDKDVKNEKGQAS